VAVTYQALVNQHLASARLILTEGTRQESGSPSLQRAFQHSALLLLKNACRCQLRVIADNYHCADIATIDNIQTLRAALAAIDSPAPEATEIEALVAEGWLGELLHAQRQLCLPASSQTPAQNLPSSRQSDIALHDESREESPLSVDKLQGWLQALEELVQRQSEMMVEY